MFEQSAQLLETLAPVVPVADFVDEQHAIRVSQLYQQITVPSVEVTLRRDNAWLSFEQVRKALPDRAIGVGTVINAEQLRKAKDLGASFAISPGISAPLVELAQSLDIAYVPGIATASELMLATQLGLKAVKFFPAEAAGGVKMLRSLIAPFPAMRFCPTGGISAANATDYLQLANVSCVGGSWVVPAPEQLHESSDQVMAQLSALYRS